MKIAFVEPDTDGIHIFQRFRLPRLGAVILATLMERAGHSVEVQVEATAPLDEAALHRADLVGISTITPTATRSYRLADRLRVGGVPVVLGGPHVTFLPEEALRHADLVVRGEGEAALAALVAALEAGGGADRFANVPNLSWRRPDGRVVHNPLAPPTDVAALPEPNWRLVRGGVTSEGVVTQSDTVPIQTSRGCPFACTFCSVTEMFGRTMRYREVDSVIEALRPHHGTRRLIFFYDDNFVVNRERTAAICEGILRANLKLTFSAQVRADVARDPELLALMRRAGAEVFYIGLESADPAVLKAMKKGQTVEEMRDNLRRIRAVGVRVHGMFALGFDADTPETVSATVALAREERLSSAQFLILIPLPGTRVHDELTAAGRVVLRDWSLYDGHHAVFRPRGFSMEGLQRAQIAAHAEFYGVRRELGWLARGRVVEALIARYARRLNRRWQKNNASYMQKIRELDGRAHCPVPALGVTLSPDA